MIERWIGVVKQPVYLHDVATSRTCNRVDGETSPNRTAFCDDRAERLPRQPTRQPSVSRVRAARRRCDGAVPQCGGFSSRHRGQYAPSPIAVVRMASGTKNVPAAATPRATVEFKNNATGICSLPTLFQVTNLCSGTHAMLPDSGGHDENPGDAPVRGDACGLRPRHAGMELRRRVLRGCGTHLAWGSTCTGACRCVLRELQSAAPPDAVHAIRSLSEYRETVTGSVEAFLVQLPMYTVKALYVAIIAVVVQLGGSSISAPFQISAVAYGGLAVLILLALARVASTLVMFAVGLALLLSPPFLEVGRLSTPDALSACLVFGGLYALVFAARPLTGAGLLLLSIVARPNNVVLCVALASWWWWKNPRGATGLSLPRRSARL